MRLGLYGGTFDPIHNAHLGVALAASEAFQLDRMLLIPNRLPPHKQSVTGASFAQRLRMVELACQPHSQLAACGIENREGKSYTIQTLEQLCIEYGGSTQFFFLIGADAFAEVLTWYRVEEVFAMTEFIVAARPGFEYSIPKGTRVHALDTLAFRESSSEIRAMLAAGFNPDGLPEAVRSYIDEQGLYRTVKVERA